MTPNRVLAPSSKLALEKSVKNNVCTDGLNKVQIHRVYSTIDVLIENYERVQGRAFFSTASFLNLLPGPIIR